MVTEATKDAVWSGLLDSVRVSRYFSVVASQHLKRRRWREITTGLAGLFAACSFVIPQLNFLLPVAAVLMILAALFDSFWPNQENLLGTVDADLSRIVTKYESLFRDANSDHIDEPTVKYVQRILEESIDNACSRVSVLYDEELAQKTQEESFQIEEAKYVKA